MTVGDNKIAGFGVRICATFKLKLLHRDICYVLDLTDIVISNLGNLRPQGSHPPPTALVQVCMAFRLKFWKIWLSIRTDKVDRPFSERQQMLLKWLSQESTFELRPYIFGAKLIALKTQWRTLSNRFTQYFLLLVRKMCQLSCLRIMSSKIRK